MLSRLKRLFPRFSLRTLTLAVLLAGSGFGLWWRWEPWALTWADVPLTGHPEALAFSPQGDRFVIWCDDEIAVYSIQTSVNLLGQFTVSEPDETHERLRIAALSWLPQARVNTIRSADGSRLLRFGAGTRIDAHLQFFNGVQLCSRRRPEPWWGLAWLPEFWLTLIFGCGLAWSVWRDQREWRNR